MRITCARVLLSLSIGGLLLILSPTADAAAPADQPVLVRMQVPANAVVWFNGSRTTQTGPSREYISPPIASGRDYTYKLRIQWVADGQTVEQNRSVTVRAGQAVDVDVNQQNISVSRGLYYPPTGSETQSAARTPAYSPSVYYSGSYFGSPDYYSSYSSGRLNGEPGRPVWEPLDKGDYARWNDGGNR